MTRIADDKFADVSNFATLAKSRSPLSRPWLDRIRTQAIARFGAVGFPSNKLEEWRHTNVSPIAKTVFTPGRHTGRELTPHVVAPFSFRDESLCEVVFVNGHFAPELSSLSDLPDGLVIRTIADAIEKDSKRLNEHLAKFADINDNPFVALNTGFIHDGALILLQRGATVEMPIHLLFLATPGKSPIASHPRVLVIAEENSEMSIVETYAGIGEGVYLTNAVTEIVAGPSARIDHCRLQQEGEEAYHISTTQVHLSHAAQFVDHSASLGAHLCRNDLNVTLAGEGAEATLNGLVLIGETQHCDNHTYLDHAAPNCPSHELYKHVLSDSASAVFKGQIVVRQIAQKTNAKQTSKTLLLSKDAMMDSQPALEIYADDVKCTHGSTTGPLDEQQLFYIRSRGLNVEAAKHLLTYAFAADITSRIKVDPVRRRVEEIMAAQHGLPRDLRIQKAAAHDEPVRA